MWKTFRINWRVCITEMYMWSIDTWAILLPTSRMKYFTICWNCRCIRCVLLGCWRYSQSPPVDHAPVSYYCCVRFVIFLLFPRFKTQIKWRYRQLPAFIFILHKTRKTIFKLSKYEINYASQNNSCLKFYNTHIYKHNWLS